MKRKGFPDCQLSFLEGDRGAVALYRTRQAGLRTFRGIGVDDTLERIRQAYPEGRVASMPLGKGMLVVYPIHALAFRLQPDNRIFEWGLLLSW
ncbi:MAG: hypothetical protein J5I98_04725 [Phaeodactylibacter sp.]|nr:hypothetical protein [Phaeodactylibacter sp.]